MDALRIGEVSKLTGVTVESVRYYERRGLLAPARRLRSGYRAFGTDAVARIRFVRQAQALGFSLEEIAALLALHPSDRASCDRVRRAAEARLAEVEQKLARLRAIRDGLAELVAACARREPSSTCPILGALSNAADPRPPRHAD